MEDGLKKCSDCGEIKSVNDFYFRNRKTQTLRPKCKHCHIKDTNAFQKNHPKRNCEYNKKQRSKSDYKEKHRIKQAIWREKNRDKDRASALKWQKKNIKRKLAANYLREEYIKRATPKWADKKDISDFYAKCPPGYHVDHIIPLRGKHVCGLHVLNNLQYLLAEVNLKKRNNFTVNSEVNNTVKGIVTVEHRSEPIKQNIMIQESSTQQCEKLCRTYRKL